ncbi:glycerol-3-phosphate dehydrogenase SDP [Salix suchowensis]|nr:glycerol-3-phosphate dehydrogenase SDP [Salix suchowensis]
MAAAFSLWGEDGNVKFQSHSTDRFFHALTDAKTQPKKKKEEVRKGSGGNVKTKLEAEPTPSRRCWRISEIQDYLNRDYLLFDDLMLPKMV